MEIGSGRVFNRGQQPDRVRLAEMRLRQGKIKVKDRQAVGLLPLADTKHTFDVVLAGVASGMHQQYRLADEDHQYQGKTSAARDYFHGRLG